MPKKPSDKISALKKLAKGEISLDSLGLAGFTTVQKTVDGYLVKGKLLNESEYTAFLEKTKLTVLCMGIQDGNDPIDDNLAETEIQAQAEKKAVKTFDTPMTIISPVIKRLELGSTLEEHKEFNEKIWN